MCLKTAFLLPKVPPQPSHLLFIAPYNDLDFRIISRFFKVKVRKVPSSVFAEFLARIALHSRGVSFVEILLLRQVSKMSKTAHAESYLFVLMAATISERLLTTSAFSSSYPIRPSSESTVSARAPQASSTRCGKFAHFQCTGRLEHPPDARCALRTMF